MQHDTSMLKKVTLWKHCMKLPWSQFYSYARVFFITVRIACANPPGLSLNWLHEPFLHHRDFHLDGLQCTVLIAVRVPNSCRATEFPPCCKRLQLCAKF